MQDYDFMCRRWIMCKAAMTCYPGWLVLLTELWCAFCGFGIGRGLERRKRTKECSPAPTKKEK